MKVDTDLVTMSVKDVFTCSLTSWYEKFKKCTIKSVILPMPPEVLAYMQDSGTLVLPEGSQPEPTYEEQKDDSFSSDDLNEWDFCESPEDETPQAVPPKFEAFNTKMKEAIENLGGSVFPKLNWSAPKDATWIALNNSLQCSTPGDIYLLLKSSTFTAHDLTSPFQDCVDKAEADTTVKYCVVLRRWMEINPAQEFRCYIKEKELIGMCQRDVSQSYSSIGIDHDNIRDDIINFWHENIENRFPLENYTFDVYRESKEKVLLVDFNPFGVTTDSLLFSWQEFKVLAPLPEEDDHDSDLDSLCEDIEGWTVNGRCIMDSNRRSDSCADGKPELRYISSDTGVQPSPYMHYGLPVDLIDLSTGGDPQKLVDFLQMRSQDEMDDIDSSDDEFVT